MKRKTLALVAVVLLVMSAGCLGIFGGENGDENGPEEGADGPGVGERDDGDSDDSPPDTDDAVNGDDDDSDDSPPDTDEVDYPVGADSDGVDWQVIVNEHYMYMESNHDSISETVEYQNSFDSFISTDEGDIGWKESATVSTQHNWDVRMYYVTVSESYEDGQTPEQTRNQEFYFDRQYTSSPTYYERVVLNGDEDISSSQEIEYRFNDGTSMNALRFIEDLEYQMVGVDEEDGETLIEYEATVEDNREVLKTPSLAEFENVDTVDVTLVVSESGQIVEFDYRVEVVVDTPDGTTTRVESLDYTYSDIDGTSVIAPDWVQEEANN